MKPKQKPQKPNRAKEHAGEIVFGGVCLFLLILFVYLGWRGIHFLGYLGERTIDALKILQPLHWLAIAIFFFAWKVASAIQSAKSSKPEIKELDKRVARIEDALQIKETLTIEVKR